MRIRSRVSVCGNRAIDETRIARRQLRITEPEFLQRTGPVILDEHIGGIAQALHELAATRILHVHADAALAHVELQKIAALMLIEHSGVLTSRIAAAWTLDLNHFRAKRDETAPDIGVCEKVAVIDEADAFQWTCRQYAPGRRGTIRRCSPRCTTSPC